MSKPDLDRIIQSPEAEAFLGMVTKGFYGTSYTGLWLFEVIGREWDEMRQWAQGLRDEINPQTCTWSIGIWEWVFGFEPDESMTLAARRLRILTKIVEIIPINPEMIRRGVLALVDGTVYEVNVNSKSGPYRFELNLHPTEDVPFSMKRIDKFVRRVKPSHLRLYARYTGPRYEIYTPESILLTLIDFHWRFPFWQIRFFDGSWNFDGSVPLDSDYGKYIKAGLIINTFGFRNGRKFDGSWEFDGSGLLNAADAVRDELRLLDLRYGIPLAERFTHGAQIHTGYGIDFWRRRFFDGSWNFDGSKPLDGGPARTDLTRLAIATFGFRNSRTFNGLWDFDGSVMLDAAGIAATAVPRLDLRSGIRTPERFSWSAKEQARYAIEFWQRSFFDGSWNLDGSVLLDADRDKTRLRRITVDTRGFRERKTFNGTWPFDGETLLDAKDAAEAAVRKLRIAAGVPLAERFSHSAQEKIRYALEFWQQAYFDGGKPLDGSWNFEDARRQKCSHTTMAVSGTEAAHRESIQGVTVERSRNPWYFDGGSTFADARLLNSFYEREEI